MNKNIPAKQMPCASPKTQGLRPSYARQTRVKSTAITFLGLLLVCFLALPATAGLSGFVDWMSGTSRNKDNRERVLTILTHNEFLRYDSAGTLRIINAEAMRHYYAQLAESGVISHIPFVQDDKDLRNFRQFWRNYFAGKELNSKDLPRDLDPFTMTSKLHSEIHDALVNDVETFGNKGYSYGETAGDLKMRGIDVIHRELRKGVAAGADAMISSLGHVTGIAFDPQDIENKAKSIKELLDNPGKAAEAELKKYAQQKLESLFEEKIKEAMGADNYDKMMSGYQKYGDKQQRLQKLMEDMYKKTGQRRFREAADLLKNLSPDAIAKKLLAAAKAGKKEGTSSKVKSDTPPSTTPQNGGWEQPGSQSDTPDIIDITGNRPPSTPMDLPPLPDDPDTSPAEMPPQEDNSREQAPVKQAPPAQPETPSVKPGEKTNPPLTKKRPEPKQTTTSTKKKTTKTAPVKPTKTPQSAAEKKSPSSGHAKKDAAKAANDEFSKRVAEAAKKFKESGGNSRYSNPPGCPVRTVMVSERTPIPQATGGDNDEDGGKEAITLDDDDYASCPEGDSECLEAERLGIVRDPVIPGSEGESPEPEPTVETPKPQQKKKLSDIEVTLVTQPAGTTLPAGQTVKVLACLKSLSPEDMPVSFDWQGQDEAFEAVASVKGEEPGQRTISVRVKGDQGATGQASVTLNIGSPEIRITRYPTRPVIMGTDVPLTAEAYIGGKKTTDSSYIFQWQPHPEVTFHPFESRKGTTRARFPTPGTYKLWVEAQQKKGSGRKTVGTSQQVTVTVQGVDMKLAATPVTPKVGQLVTVTATLTPPIDSSLVRLVWEADGNIKKGGPLGNGLRYSFIAADAGPVTLKAKVLAKEGDLQELASEALTVRAQKYSLSVTSPKRLGPPPRRWDPATGTIVDVPQGIAAFQNAEVSCTITPTPPGAIRYRWEASPSGCTISAPFSATTRVNGSHSGSYQIRVTATDGDGIELGSGSTTLNVTVSKRDLELAKIKAADLAKARKLLQQARALWDQGRLHKAIALITTATKLADQESAILNEQKRFREQKKQIDTLLQQVATAIQQGDLEGAEKDLAAAAAISKKYAGYLATAKHLANARKKVATIVASAKQSWQNNKRPEAIKEVQSALRLDKSNQEAQSLLTQWTAEQTQLERKRQGLLKNGASAEKAQKFSTAITLLQQAQAIRSTTNVQTDITRLQGKLQVQQQAEQQFKKLLHDAQQAAGKKEFARALQLVNQALKIHPKDATARSLQQTWQNNLREQQLNDKFNKLIADGYQQEKNNQFEQAIKVYQKALTIRADAAVATHVGELQKKLKDQQAARAKRLKAEDDEFNKLIQAGYTYEKNNQLGKAISTYQHALTIRHDKKIRHHISELQEALHKQQQAREKAKEKEEKEFNRLLKKGYSYEQNNQLKKAISAYEQALSIRDDTKIRHHISELQEARRKQQQTQKKLQADQDNKKFERLIQAGYTHEKNNRLAKAISSYQQALKIRRDQKISDHILELKARIKQDKINRQKKSDARLAEAKRLVKKGFEFEKKGELKAAIKFYKKAHSIRASKNVAARIDKLEKQLRRQMAQKAKPRPKPRPAAAPTYWTGSFQGSIASQECLADHDCKMILTLNLTQNGRHIGGNGKMRLITYGQYGEDHTFPFPLSGSCNNKSANIQLQGDGDTMSLSATLSSDNNRISTSFQGQAITLRRTR